MAFTRILRQLFHNKIVTNYRINKTKKPKRPPPPPKKVKKDPLPYMNDRIKC